MDFLSSLRSSMVLMLALASCAAPLRVWPELEADASAELQVIYAILDEDLGQGWHAWRTRPEHRLVVTDWDAEATEVLPRATPMSSSCFTLIHGAALEARLYKAGFYEGALRKVRVWYDFDRPLFSADGRTCFVTFHRGGGGCASISEVELEFTDSGWKTCSRRVLSIYSYE